MHNADAFIKASNKRKKQKRRKNNSINQSLISNAITSGDGEVVCSEEQTMLRKSEIIVKPEHVTTQYINKFSD